MMKWVKIALLLAVVSLLLYVTDSEAKQHEYFKTFDDIYIEIKICGVTKYILVSNSGSVYWDRAKNWSQTEINSVKTMAKAFVLDDNEGCTKVTEGK